MQYKVVVGVGMHLTFAPSSTPDWTRLQTLFLASGEMRGPRSAPGCIPSLTLSFLAGQREGEGGRGGERKRGREGRREREKEIAREKVISIHYKLQKRCACTFIPFSTISGSHSRASPTKMAVERAMQR